MYDILENRNKYDVLQSVVENEANKSSAKASRNNVADFNTNNDNKSLPTNGIDCNNLSSTLMNNTNELIKLSSPYIAETSNNTETSNTNSTSNGIGNSNIITNNFNTYYYGTSRNNGTLYFNQRSNLNGNSLNKNNNTSILEEKSFSEEVINLNNTNKLIMNIFDTYENLSQRQLQFQQNNKTENFDLISEFKHSLIVNLRDSMPINHLIQTMKYKQSNIGLYPCRIGKCYNIYQSKGSLRRHIYTHTGERPYVCKFLDCNKSYVTSDRLAEHLNTHTNLRPFKCNFNECNKAYNDSKTLREHKRTHGEKTFHCEKCEKSFHRKTHLKQHLKIHENRSIQYNYSKFEDDISSKNSEDGNLNVNNKPKSSSNLRSLLNNNDSSHFIISNKQHSD